MPKRVELVAANQQEIYIIPVVNAEAERRAEDSIYKRIVKRVDQRFIPFIVLLEILSYLNRTSIGQAKLMEIQNDLNMSQSEMNWAIAIFFLTYLIFVIPSCMLMRLIGLTFYLSLAMIAWGSISIGMAFVTNAQQLLAVRALLGIAQSGYFPGIVLYISWWYCKKERSMRIAILMAAVSAASVLNGILAYGFTFMEGIRGLKDWQWMFLLESVPIIPLGVITWFFLDNFPNAVRWLIPTDVMLLTNHLLNDNGAANNELIYRTKFSWRQMSYVFIDWRIYLYALVGMGNYAITKYLTTYLPSLVDHMGYDNAEIHLLTAPPYVVACLFCLLVGYSLSRRGEHAYHLVFTLLVALFGFILMVTLIDRGKVAIYISSHIAYGGVLSGAPVLLSWSTSNIDGYTKRTIAIGFILGIGQIGGIVLPLVYEDNQSSYKRGYLICIGLIVASLIVTLILRCCLALENKRRKNLTSDKFEREAAIKEPCDWHPQKQYAL